jgi:hypothetical protein
MDKHKNGVLRGTARGPARRAGHDFDNHVAG